jgi:hypothetical protein
MRRFHRLLRLPGIGRDLAFLFSITLRCRSALRMIALSLAVLILWHGEQSSLQFSTVGSPPSPSALSWSNSPA